VLAKLNNVASVPRRDRLSIESVVMGVDGKTGPKTSPIKEEELDLIFQIQIHADIFLPHNVMDALGLPKT